MPKNVPVHPNVVWVTSKRFTCRVEEGGLLLTDATKTVSPVFLFVMRHLHLPAYGNNNFHFILVRVRTSNTVIPIKVHCPCLNYIQYVLMYSRLHMQPECLNECLNDADDVYFPVIRVSRHVSCGLR